MLVLTGRKIEFMHRFILEDGHQLVVLILLVQNLAILPLVLLPVLLMLLMLLRPALSGRRLSPGPILLYACPEGGRCGRDGPPR